MIKAIVNQDKEFNIENTAGGIEVNGKPVEVDVAGSNGFFHVLFENKSYDAELVSVNRDDKTVIVRINGSEYSVKLSDEYDTLLHTLGFDLNKTKAINNLKAPMPGLVVDILVQPGDTIKKGDSMVILEAMKMENILKAQVDVVVKKVNIKKGDKVEKNEILLLFDN